MDKEFEEKLNTAFDGLLEGDIKKAQKNEEGEKPEVEEDEEMMVEKAVAMLSKNKYKDDDEMISKLQGAGYSKAVCKKAMNKFKAKAVKKAIDDELDFELGDDEAKKGLESESENELDVTEFIESLPNMFTSIDEKISKGLGENKDINIAVAKGIRILGHAYSEMMQKQDQLIDIVKALAGEPIKKGISGGVINKKFGGTTKESEVKENRDVKKGINILDPLKDKDLIEKALLKINTLESRDTMREFAINKNLDVLKGFKPEIELHTGKELITE